MQMSGEKCAFSSPFWTVSWFSANAFTIYHISIFVLDYEIEFMNSIFNLNFLPNRHSLGWLVQLKLKFIHREAFSAADDGAAADFSDLCDVTGTIFLPTRAWGARDR